MPRFFLQLGIVAFLPFAGCSSNHAPSPFVEDAGRQPDGSADSGIADVATRDGPVFGQACADDSQCDDGLDCTLDSCNLALRRCQFIADDSRCQNGVFCDGVERCDPELGCRRGSIVDCNDDQTCTIDNCVEATESCEHKPRDADGDGVTDGHCQPDGDCDDADPAVYPGHVEVCGNAKDDNCDGRIDEMPCTKPMHDTCLDPLVIDQTGVYELDTTAASFDYPGSCAPMDAVRRRDVVAALVLAVSADVDMVAEAPFGAVSVGIGKECAILASELACGKGVAGSAGNELARVRLHSLAAGTYPVYVWTDRDEMVLLRLTLTAPTSAPTNETCGSAAPIALGMPTVASLVGSSKDLVSRCGFETGDLVYRFDLPASSDVTARGVSIDGYGAPVVSIRDATCAAPADASEADELTCGYGSPARAFARALAPGTYYLAVSASAPTDVEVEVVASAPTTAPADEKCEGAPMLAANRTIDVSLAGHTDDIDLGCAKIASVDAAYDLELATASDVLLVERIAQGDTAAISLALPSCTGASSTKACARGGGSPLRATVRGVPAGGYRVVAESIQANPVELTAFVRPAVGPTLVPFADTCSSAIPIAAGGGFYQGNTANQAADYSAGCDVTGVPPLGAADQMLALTLGAKKRVVFDMQGSAYATLLDIRKGATCPGIELPGACSAGYLPLRSYLDLTLDPGIYWVQVDGYGGDSGIWFLDVRIVDP